MTAKRMHESIATTRTVHDEMHMPMRRPAIAPTAPEVESGGDGLQKVTINDIILFAVAKTLKDFGYMNSHFLGDRMVNFTHVHLGCAVDTPGDCSCPSSSSRTVAP